MTEVIGFSSSITFSGGPGVLSLEDDYKIANGSPPFVYKENYERYFGERSKQLPPQDLSLFSKKPDPIKVPINVATSYSNDANAAANYADKRNSVVVDDFSDFSTPNRDYSDFASTSTVDTGSTKKKVNPDAPEDNFDPFLVESDDEFYSNNTDRVPGLDNKTKNIKVNGTTSAKTNEKTKPNFTENLSKVKIDPVDNELNVFSSVTYNIALYMMNSKSYVDITSLPNDPNVVLDPKSGVSQLLMRSGGTGIDNPNNDFNNEFFIDDLEIQNIAVGPDKFRHNTNATNIRFVITEPRGVTLLEKLQRLAGTVLRSTKEKYIHAPFLLEISFKGHDENGRAMPASSKPKYIPIKITDMTFEVNASGTQYTVQAIPYANHILGSVISTIPHNIELKASTVGDIFTNEIEQSRKVPDRIADNPGLARAAGVKEGATIFKTEKTKHKNLAEILTDSRRRRTKPTQILLNDGTKKDVPPAAENYDTYNFLIADEIAKAKINLEDIYSALNTPTPTESGDQTSGDQKQYETYVRGIARGITLDKDTQTFAISAGTDITKLINLVILHSSYMDKNIVENPPQTTQVGDPVNWFRIRSVIESANSKGGGYDAKDGRYKYSISYIVEKNVIHYADFPWAKKSKPVGIGYHKKYDYIFTGKNTEVLDFQLKFNTAFLQVMTAGTGSPFANKPASTPFTPQVKELPSSAEGNTINTPDQLQRRRSKDLFSSVMSDGVDLVNLDLRIVGDPAWIPTSDAFWQDKVRKGESYTTAFMPDGTINYNLTPPFIQLNLKTPVDYDETTGLQNPTAAGGSSFNGVYRISSCESTFSGGVFQQRLSGFRPPGQDADISIAGKNYGNNNASVQERKGLLDTFKDVKLQYVSDKGQSVSATTVIDDQFEDYDYDQPMDGVV